MPASSNKYLVAVIYARYSSHSQRDVAIEQQVAACKRFAEKNGIKVVTVYEDRAMTGTNDRRPGFQKMMKDAEKGGWNYVIVYSLDRFARDRYDSAVYKRQLKNCGVKVLSAMENISDDPSGVLMESLLEGLAEYYSKELSQKIRRGMEDNASKCMVNGSVPLGFVRGSDGRYAIEEAEAATVLEIFNRVRAGEPFAVIIDSLNARGIRTKKGKVWNKSSFGRILSNERYTGVYIYGDTRIEGGVPQIISPELFCAVQATLHTKRNPRSGGSPQRRRRDNGTYLLTGKLFCGKCKSPMIGISGKSQAATPYYYYVCKTRRSDHTCDKAMIRRDLIEHRITQALKEYMLTDEGISALADAAVEYQRQSSANAEADALERRLKEITQAIGNLLAAMEAGIFTASTKARLMELENEQRLVSGQLSIAREETAGCLTREDIIAALSLFQEGDTNDKDYQEALIDTFLVAAYLYDDNLKVVFNIGNDRNTEEIPFDIEDIETGTDVCIDTSELHQKESTTQWRSLFDYPGDSNLSAGFLKPAGLTRFAGFEQHMKGTCYSPAIPP